MSKNRETALVEDIYQLPAPTGTTVAIKTIDMLGDELLVTETTIRYKLMAK